MNIVECAECNTMFRDDPETAGVCPHGHENSWTDDEDNHMGLSSTREAAAELAASEPVHEFGPHDIVATVDDPTLPGTWTRVLCNCGEHFCSADLETARFLHGEHRIDATWGPGGDYRMNATDDGTEPLGEHPEIDAIVEFGTDEIVNIIPGLDASKITTYLLPDDRQTQALNAVRELCDDLVARGQGCGAAPTRADLVAAEVAESILAVIDEAGE